MALFVPTQTTQTTVIQLFILFSFSFVWVFFGKHAYLRGIPPHLPKVTRTKPEQNPIRWRGFKYIF